MRLKNDVTPNTAHANFLRIENQEVVPSKFNTINVKNESSKIVGKLKIINDDLTKPWNKKYVETCVNFKNTHRTASRMTPSLDVIR